MGFFTIKTLRSNYNTAPQMDSTSSTSLKTRRKKKTQKQCFLWFSSSSPPTPPPLRSRHFPGARWKLCAEPWPPRLPVQEKITKRLRWVTRKCREGSLVHFGRYGCDLIWHDGWKWMKLSTRCVVKYWIQNYCSWNVSYNDLPIFPRNASTNI